MSTVSNRTDKKNGKDVHTELVENVNVTLHDVHTTSSDMQLFSTRNINTFCECSCYSTQKNLMC